MSATNNSIHRIANLTTHDCRNNNNSVPSSLSVYKNDLRQIPDSMDLKTLSSSSSESTDSTSTSFDISTSSSCSSIIPQVKWTEIFISI